MFAFCAVVGAGKRPDADLFPLPYKTSSCMVHIRRFTHQHWFDALRRPIYKSGLLRAGDMVAKLSEVNAATKV